MSETKKEEGKKYLGRRNRATLRKLITRAQKKQRDLEQWKEDMADQLTKDMKMDVYADMIRLRAGFVLDLDGKTRHKISVKVRGEGRRKINNIQGVADSIDRFLEKCAIKHNVAVADINAQDGSIAKVDASDVLEDVEDAEFLKDTVEKEKGQEE